MITILLMADVVRMVNPRSQSFQQSIYPSRFLFLPTFSTQSVWNTGARPASPFHTIIVLSTSNLGYALKTGHSHNASGCDLESIEDYCHTKAQRFSGECVSQLLLHCDMLCVDPLVGIRRGSSPAIPQPSPRRSHGPPLVSIVLVRSPLYRQSRRPLPSTRW